MFSRAYQVQKVTIEASSGLLQVLPVGERLTPGPHLAVDSDPTRKVVVRGGRSLFDENKQRLPEAVLIIELPAFDIHSLVGERLVPVG